MDIKPHNIVIDDHLNPKNHFYLYGLKEKDINNYYKIIYKVFEIKFNKRKKSISNVCSHF